MFKVLEVISEQTKGRRLVADLARHGVLEHLNCGPFDQLPGLQACIGPVGRFAVQQQLLHDGRQISAIVFVFVESLLDQSGQQRAFCFDQVSRESDAPAVGGPPEELATMELRRAQQPADCRIFLVCIR